MATKIILKVIIQHKGFPTYTKRNSVSYLDGYWETHHLVFLLHSLQECLHSEKEGGRVCILTVLDHKLLERERMPRPLRMD